MKTIVDPANANDPFEKLHRPAPARAIVEVISRAKHPLTSTEIIDQLSFSYSVIMAGLLELYRNDLISRQRREDSPGYVYYAGDNAPKPLPVHEWTSETRAEALRLINEGYSNKEVAKEMSRRLQEEVSVFKVAAILPKQKAKESTIHRNCLKCQRAFTTDSKYIRMCEGCRKSANDAGML